MDNSLLCVVSTCAQPACIPAVSCAPAECQLRLLASCSATSSSPTSLTPISCTTHYYSVHSALNALTLVAQAISTNILKYGHQEHRRQRDVL